MENQSDKFTKPEEKNHQEGGTTLWANLPCDILGFIIGKLLNTADVIRFGAVCKNWQIPIDRIIRSKDFYGLPWLCGISGCRSKGQGRVLKCEMFAPNSREVIKTWNEMFVPSSRQVIETLKSVENFQGFDVYGSKEGWLIADTVYNGLEERLLFLYNPYSKEIISLPSLVTEYHKLCFATFSCDPDSPDCQVFVLLSCKYKYYYEIAICQPYVDNKWTFDNMFIQTGKKCWGMQYMNGHLLFLFDDAILRRYSLAEGTCTRLNRRKRVGICNFPNRSKERWWLVMGKGDILVACKINLEDGVCSYFYFDWSVMDWAENGLLKDTAIFVSGRTGMLRPFVDHDDPEDTKDCRVFFYEYWCYTFVRGRMMESREYDDWVWLVQSVPKSMTFIEPPRIS